MVLHKGRTVATQMHSAEPWANSVEPKLPPTGVQWLAATEDLCGGAVVPVTPCEDRMRLHVDNGRGCFAGSDPRDYVRSLEALEEALELVV